MADGYKRPGQALELDRQIRELTESGSRFAIDPALTSALVGFHTALEQRAGRRLKLPNLIGVGASRAGTTSLFGMLAPCQEIYASPLKELNFFGIRQEPFRLSGLTLSDYATFFLGGEGARYRFEISPVYLTRPISLEMIWRCLPSVKVIITLRDPLARFLSQFRHHLDIHGIDDINTYANKALENLTLAATTSREWHAPEKNLANSLYSEGVSACFRLFGEQNCLVLILEDFTRDPDEWRRALSNFLQLEIQAPREEDQNQSPGMAMELEPKIQAGLQAIFRKDFALMPQSVVRRIGEGVWPSVVGVGPEGDTFGETLLQDREA